MNCKTCKEKLYIKHAYNFCDNSSLVRLICPSCGVIEDKTIEHTLSYTRCDLIESIERYFANA